MLTYLIILSIFFIQCTRPEDNDVFVPTKEWQTVKKGQKIPKGLHVRINLETGETEAKLLDALETPEDKTKALSALPEDEKTIPNSNPYTPDELKTIKDKFRSYDEIKKSLDELNLTPKMDTEIIAELLKRHKEVLDKNELLKILEDLDFLAHQYDNAREFVKMNGFQDVIYKDLNATNAEVRRETLKLMTALMQNNVAPKIHAFETGSVAVLLRLVNFDPDPGVKNRALSALGALLRSFPAAQRKFVESGGWSVLSKFLDTDDIKFQIRLVTMVSDLLVEHKYAAVDENLSKYYVKFDLTERILEHDWCKKLNKLLLGLLITDKDDHDSIEKCLTAMHSLRAHCGDKYEKELIKNLRKRYQELGVEEDNNSTFFTSLGDLCDEILHHINISVKTEL